MTDLIEEAIGIVQEETERTASGNVKGHHIKVLKKEYEIEQRGPTAWKVAVYVDDDGPLATEQEKNLEANEAQELFEELTNKYALAQ